MDFNRAMQDLRKRKELSLFLKNHCMDEARRVFPTEVAADLIRKQLLHVGSCNARGFIESLTDDAVWELAGNPKKVDKCWQEYNTGRLTGVAGEDAQSRIIGVVGCKPERLYGYDITEWRWTKIKKLFKEILLKENATAGMSLGVCQVFAMSVLELKEQGYDNKTYSHVAF